jgi:hypothetical protein
MSGMAPSTAATVQASWRSSSPLHLPILTASAGAVTGTAQQVQWPAATAQTARSIRWNCSAKTGRTGRIVDRPVVRKIRHQTRRPQTPESVLRLGRDGTPGRLRLKRFQGPSSVLGADVACPSQVSAETLPRNRATGRRRRLLARMKRPVDATFRCKDVLRVRITSGGVAPWRSLQR